MSNARRRHRRRWRAARTQRRYNARNVALLVAFSQFEREDQRRAFLRANPEFTNWVAYQLGVFEKKFSKMLDETSIVFRGVKNTVEAVQAKLSTMRPS